MNRVIGRSASLIASSASLDFGVFSRPSVSLDIILIIALLLSTNRRERATHNGRYSRFSFESKEDFVGNLDVSSTFMGCFFYPCPKTIPIRKNNLSF